VTYFSLYAHFADIHDFWLSATDIGWAPGYFHWPDDTRVDESTWFPGGGGYAPQPYNFGAGKEACVWLHTLYAGLFDAECSDISSILFEIPASLSFCL
jgi:hypothetical protein